jgi:hypothetical protein
MAHSEASLARRQASGNIWNQCDAPLSTVVSSATAILLILARAGHRRSLDHLSQPSWPYFTRSTGHCDKMPT